MIIYLILFIFVILYRGVDIVSFYSMNYTYLYKGLSPYIRCFVSSPYDSCATPSFQHIDVQNSSDKGCVFIGLFSLPTLSDFFFNFQFFQLGNKYECFVPWLSIGFGIMATIIYHNEQ